MFVVCVVNDILDFFSRYFEAWNDNAYSVKYCNYSSEYEHRVCSVSIGWDQVMWGLILHLVLMLHKMASSMFACEKRPSESFWFALHISFVLFLNIYIWNWAVLELCSMFCHQQGLVHLVHHLWDVFILALCGECQTRQSPHTNLKNAKEMWEDRCWSQMLWQFLLRSACPSSMPLPATL